MDSTNPAPEVAAARKADVRELAHTLARAFFDDPVMTWMLPQPGRRAKALPTMFAAMARHHFLGDGGVEVATAGGHIAAAALWSPPGRWKTTTWQELRMMRGFVRAFGMDFKRGKQVEELMAKHHPEQPHWYLGVIGSDPTFRGGGFGHALMAARLTASTPSTPRPIWSPAIPTTCPTTNASASTSPARSSCPTAAR